MDKETKTLVCMGLLVFITLAIIDYHIEKKQDCEFTYENRYYEYRKLCMDNQCAYSYKRYTSDNKEKFCYRKFKKTCCITCYRACVNS